jgi:hypothetical protein
LWHIFQATTTSIPGNTTQHNRMAILPPPIQTYHCLCTSLLLASTHTLSNLPQRSTASGSLDAAIILPLPPSPPDLAQADTVDLPEEGYNLLLGLIPEKKTTIVRREDGFEKRVLYRCSRCRLVIGYELQSQALGGGEAMEIDGGEKGKGRDGYVGKVVYLLPAGSMSTGVMMGEGKRVGEEDVGIRSGDGAVAVFE